MEQYPLLIPNIVPKIEAKLKELGLKAEVGPALFVEQTKGKKHRYSSLCYNQKGEPIFFFALLHQKPAEIEKMATEVKLAQYFKKHSVRYLPKYYDSKMEQGFGWLLREYLPEYPLENPKDIETLRKSISVEIMAEIVKSIMDFNKLATGNFKFLKKFPLKNFLELPERIAKNKILAPKKIKRFQELLEKNQKLLEAENKYLCHGDFQIGNIVEYDNKLKIVDIETARLNNFAFDIAFLTTRLWKHKDKRKWFIEKYMSLLPKEKIEVFKVLFRIDCAFIAYYTYMSTPREYTETQLKQRRAFYKKMLAAISQSFEQLASL